MPKSWVDEQPPLSLQHKPHDGRTAFCVARVSGQDDQQAAAVYNNVRKKYPRSKLVAESLYRLGECFEKLNLPEDAKLFYKTVKQKHRKSAAAKRATQRLKELN